MNGYNIFTHAQYHEKATVDPARGGVAEPARSFIVGEKPNEQKVGDCGEAGHDNGQCGNESCIVSNNPKRVRSPKGWAVEAGLGLGPQFNEKKKS